MNLSEKVYLCVRRDSGVIFSNKQQKVDHKRELGTSQSSNARVRRKKNCKFMRMRRITPTNMKR